MTRINSIAVLAVMALMVPLASAGSHIEKGKGVFDSKCLMCHNVDSKEKKIGPGLAGIKDGKLPSGKDATKENTMEMVNKGGNGMPGYEAMLSEEERNTVVAYVLTL